MQPMPGFADKLDDQQVADMVNYLRQLHKIPLYEDVRLSVT